MNLRATTALVSLALLGAAPPDDSGPRLWQLDCGTIVFSDVGSFDDTFSLDGKTGVMNTSCYLIQHGERYMLWDTGLPPRYLKATQDTEGGVIAGSFRATYDEPLTAQLAHLGVNPDQIEIVAISHHHLDHAGQASLFPKASLYIGKQDLAAVRAVPAPPGAEPALLAPWITGRAPVVEVAGDKDIFGDGSVVMLATPGHTPGHHSLLVRFREAGPVLLTGDLYHLHVQRESGGVPIYNASRADTLASYDRFNAVARTLRATIVIQHDPADKAKLAPFPQATE